MYSPPNISSIANDESEKTRSEVTSRVAWVSSVAREHGANGNKSKTNQERLSPARIVITLVREMQDEEEEKGCCDDLKSYFTSLIFGHNFFANFLPGMGERKGV